jgi:hypothetical protein
MGGPGPEDGRPEVAPSVVHPPSAEVGAEHHRPIVGGFSDDRYRPRRFPPVIGRQVRQQFYHGPVPGGVEATVWVRAWRSASKD